MSRIIYEDASFIDFEKSEGFDPFKDNLKYIFAYHDEEIYFFNDVKGKDVEKDLKWYFHGGKCIYKFSCERLVLVPNNEVNDSTISICKANKDRTKIPIMKIVCEDTKQSTILRQNLTNWIKKRNFVMGIGTPMALDYNDLDKPSLTSSMANMAKQDYHGLVMIC